MIFSDETYIEVSARKSQYVRRSPGEALRDSHRTTRRAFVPKVLVWSCFNERGLGCVHITTGTMNTAKYIDVLANELIPSSHMWFGDSRDFVYLQDNAPCHKSRDTKKFFEDNQLNVMDWPPYSPDLNPIENLWAILKAKLREKSFTSIEELSEEVTRLWKNSDFLKNQCVALSRSMPKRVKDCIRLRGGATNY